MMNDNNVIVRNISRNTSITHSTALVGPDRFSTDLAVDLEMRVANASLKDHEIIGPEYIKCILVDLLLSDLYDTSTEELKELIPELFL